MQTLVLLGIVGFLAQLINGSLGMGYGVTSTTFLLTVGTSPALASATVNLSQVGSQLASGIAHWRFGNVDWSVVRRIALPGALGAFLGASFLSRLPPETAGSLMSTILVALGLYIMARFTLRDTPRVVANASLPRSFVTPLGLVAGFMNSTGGGGWGPIGTSALLASGKLEPRKVIGSISATEFVVVVAGSAGFATSLGLSGIDVTWVAVMLLCGTAAAPIAAWLARLVPARMLGSIVGGLIIMTNIRTVFAGDWMPAPLGTRITVYVALALAWVCAIAWSTRAHFLDTGSRVTSDSPASSGK